MRFLSLCSGIEAASVAWAPLGWKAAAVAEIEAFPSAVLAHHYPDVPNLGDITKFKEWPDLGPIDLICGGTPCQSFSVAGLRKGLADPRGNLSLTFLTIVDRYRPRYVVWENVPGVLSSDGGRDFASFLGGLGQLGYGWCFRVLDAQFCRVDGFPRAVPQRRRRVFVVGYLGDWRRAAAVFSEPESVLGDTPPRREARERVAGTLTSSLGRRCGQPNDDNPADYLIGFGGGNRSGPIDVAASLAAHGYAGRRQEDDDNLVAHSLRPEGFDASEDGTGRGTPIVPICFDARQSDAIIYGDKAGPLDTDAFSQAVQAGWAVRRLTPTECERLQGFPDDYTAIPYRGKPAADGPRYKALGNSWAVNVARWVGRRIEMVEQLAGDSFS